jgi:hypothetical protein
LPTFGRDVLDEAGEENPRGCVTAVPAIENRCRGALLRAERIGV